MIAGPAEFLLNVNVLLPQDGKISGIGATLAATKTKFVSYFASDWPGGPGRRAAQVGTGRAGHSVPGRGDQSVERRPETRTQVTGDQTHK